MHRFSEKDNNEKFSPDEQDIVTEHETPTGEKHLHIVRVTRTGTQAWTTTLDGTIINHETEKEREFAEAKPKEDFFRFPEA